MKWAHNYTKSNVETHWNSEGKKKADVESTSSSVLGRIVLDLDIWVRFGFNYGIGFKINFVLGICIRFGFVLNNLVKLVFGICLWCL